MSFTPLSRPLETARNAENAATLYSLVMTKLITITTKYLICNYWDLSYSVTGFQFNELYVVD